MPSKRTDLKIINNTTLNITRIWINEIDNYDWDGSSRPDHNFHNVSIAAQESRSQREEINSHARSSWYRMHIEFENGDKITFRNDQQDALHKHHRDYSFQAEGHLKTAYEIFQSSGSGWNTMTISYKIPVKNWMSKLSDDLSLKDICIPGTHESCSHYGGDMVKCQDMDLKKQLESGVRFIDIRCRPVENLFTIHHGVVYQHMNFDDVCRICNNFLHENPSDTIIMSIKREHTTQDCTIEFDEIFLNYVKKYSSKDRWYLSTTPDIPNTEIRSIPQLKDVRGKIVLFRRSSNADWKYGIRAFGWKDNETFEINKYGIPMKIQDKYKVPTIFDRDDKWKKVKSLIQEANNNKDNWYFNFSSGVSSGAYPNAVANFVNDKLHHHLEDEAPKRTGVLIMDFPGSHLVKCVIDLNFSQK